MISCARHGIKCTMYVNSLNSHSNPMRSHSYSPFLTDGTLRHREIKQLPRITQLVSGTAGI